MNYHYPIDMDWSKEEVVDVIRFLTMIEKAYESKVKRIDLLDGYHDFKKVIPSKSEEKQILSLVSKKTQGIRAISP